MLMATDLLTYAPLPYSWDPYLKSGVLIAVVAVICWGIWLFVFKKK